MGKPPTPQEQRVIVPNVSWQQFETLLLELGEDRSTRLTYDRKRLELMTPTGEHERCHRLIESLILLLSDERHLEVTSIGSILLKNRDLGLATEPDGCYFFQNRSHPDRRDLDLTQADVPKLVVEVALTKSAIEKLPIYAALGIGEVWRYVTQAGENALKGNLTIYQLDSQLAEGYSPTASSTAFPFLTADRVLEFLEQSDTLGLAQALRLLRSWTSGLGNLE